MFVHFAQNTTLPGRTTLAYSRLSVTFEVMTWETGVVKEQESESEEERAREEEFSKGPESRVTENDWMREMRGVRERERREESI